MSYFKKQFMECNKMEIKKHRKSVYMKKKSEYLFKYLRKIFKKYYKLHLKIQPIVFFALTPLKILIEKRSFLGV